MQSPQLNLRSLQEIPSTYRSVFANYPWFNVVQSAVFHEAIDTDHSLVVSAPTGSGKTAIFEMAIVRHLMLAKESADISNKKIIYISPIKALCKERLVDWHKKFAGFGLSCVSATSDTDDLDVKNIAQYNIIISTPEKWDVLTRRWREAQNLIGSISLFLVDEVHLLNTDSRGSTLEVIVNRMKTAVVSLMFSQEKSSIRFIALSATIPNIEDIAEWIGPSEPAKYFKFSEDVRPVRLNKIVIGYHFNPQTQSNFKFDMSLSYKLAGLISKYSEGKPTLIFCSTRKSVEMTANHLVSNLQIRLSQDQKEVLNGISQQLTDSKLKQYVIHGIAFHHAGLIQDNRWIIEESFRKGYFPILVTTSTLAIGVNLPAHLVIVKSTKCYTDGGYKDYDEVSIFQMIGRAGRNQFHSSATALILTSTQDKEKYEQMLRCTQTIESNLHKHLTEHLNAEVVLRTITDLEVAMRWLSSTFLYVRARRSPERYKLPVGLCKEKIDKKLLEMCQIDLNKLVRAGMIKINDAIEISPTVVGEIMAKYYVAFDTMNLFTQITGTEILIQILAIISKCKEFSEIYLRINDKKCLNMLNKNLNKESNRFPLTGKIKTVDMKVNCIIQAILGNLDIHDQSILCDSIKIMRSCERLAKCLIEYLETRDKCFSAMLSTIILAKCFRVKLWENSPYVSKQLSGVGRVISTLLMKAGKTTFKEIAATNPRHIEMIAGRKAPFGNTVVADASHLPEYTLTLEKQADSVELIITILNPGDIEEKPTVSLDSIMTLLVGDSSNNILLYEKYSHAYMLDNPKVRRSISLNDQKLEYIKASLISENWVGIDCSYKLELSDKISNHDANENKNRKQTFMDLYMKHVKKADTYKKKYQYNVKEIPVDDSILKHNTNKLETHFDKTGENQDKELDINGPLEKICGLDETGESATKDSKSNKNSNKKAKCSKKRNIIISKSIFHSATKNKSEKKLKKSKSKRVSDDDNFLSESHKVVEEKKYDKSRNEINIFNELVDKNEDNKLKSNAQILFCETSLARNFGKAQKPQSYLPYCILGSNIENSKTDKLAHSENTTLNKYCENVDVLDNKRVAEYSEHTNSCVDTDQQVEDSEANEETMEPKNGKKKEETLDVSNDSRIFGNELFNSDSFEQIRKKYKNDKSENLSPKDGKVKKNMDYPDSTAEYGTFQRDLFASHIKKPKKDESYGFPFEVFPQRSVKWRSPLVHTSVEKFSPHNKPFCFDPGEGGSRFKTNTEGNELRLGTQDTSSSSMNSIPFENWEERLNRSNPSSGKTLSAKKKPNYQFPLSDQDCMVESNESFNKKVKDLDNICDLEYFGLADRKKESPVNSSLWSKSHVGKYYNQLVMNNQLKTNENDPKIEAPKCAQNKQEDSHISTPRNLQFSQPLQKVESAGSIQSQQNPKHFHNTQPLPREYQQYQPNIPFPERHYVEVTQTIPEPDTSASTHNRNCLTQRRHFNPYMYEHRFQASPYFSRQRPRLPASCMCYAHHPARCLGMNPYYDPYIEPVMEASACCNRHHSHAYRSRITDIPEDYIDQCLQQYDERFIPPPPPTMPYCAPDIGNFNICEKENMNATENHGSFQLGGRNSYEPTGEDEFQISRANVGQMFAPTPKPQLAHNPPGFALAQSQKSMMPGSVRSHTSLLPSLKRRMLNSNSFEERLDNIIMPRSQAFSLSTARDQRFDSAAK